MRSDKYDLENLPIRDDIRKQLNNNKVGDIAAIDLLHSIGRMLSLQDDAYEEQFKGIFSALCSINKNLNSIKRKISKIEKSLVETQGEVEVLKQTG